MAFKQLVVDGRVAIERTNQRVVVEPKVGAGFPAGLSLQLRLTLFFAGFLVLVLIFVGVLVYSLTRRSLIDNLEAQTSQAYADVLESIRQNPSSFPTSRSNWVQSLPSDALLYVNIYLSSLGGPLAPPIFVAFERPPRLSTVVVSPAGEGLVSLVGEENFTSLRQTGQLDANVTATDGTIWVVRARREIFSLSTAGLPSFDSATGITDAPTLVAVAMPVRSDTLTQLRTNLIQTILVALIVFPFGVWLLAQRALTPLKRMTKAASRISSQDLSQRVPGPQKPR